MLLGLVQFVFRSYVKLIVNSLFVVGSLLMLVYCRFDWKEPAH